jgi:hypothetical protein
MNTTGAINAVSANLKDQPLLFVLIVLNMIFLATLIYIVNGASKASNERFNNQDKFLHELARTCLEKRGEL